MPMARGALYLIYFFFRFVVLLVCLLLPLDRCKSDGMSRVCCSRLLIGSCSRCVQDKKRREEKRRAARPHLGVAWPANFFFFLRGFSFFTFFSFLYFYFSLSLSLVLWRTLDLYSSVYIRQAGSYTQNKSRHPSAPTDDRIPCAMPRTESLRHQLMSV